MNIVFFIFIIFVILIIIIISSSNIISNSIRLIFIDYDYNIIYAYQNLHNNLFNYCNLIMSITYIIVI